MFLNNKIFSFISDIQIEFKNDFDNKINLNRLPIELNRLINSYLITEDSINIDTEIHFKFATFLSKNRKL